jgi:hypothetical protein
VRDEGCVGVAAAPEVWKEVKSVSRRGGMLRIHICRGCGKMSVVRGSHLERVWPHNAHHIFQNKPKTKRRKQNNHSRRPTDNANPTSPPNQPLRNPFPKRRTRRIPMHQHNFPPTLRAPLIDPHAPMRSLDISSTRIVIRWVRQSGDFVRGEMGDLCR